MIKMQSQIKIKKFTVQQLFRKHKKHATFFRCFLKEVSTCGEKNSTNYVLDINVLRTTGIK